jgi:hypothetical protein
LTHPGAYPVGLSCAGTEETRRVRPAVWIELASYCVRTRRVLYGARAGSAVRGADTVSVLRNFECGPAEVTRCLDNARYKGRLSDTPALPAYNNQLQLPLVLNSNDFGGCFRSRCIPRGSVSSGTC